MKYSQEQFNTAIDALRNIELTISEQKNMKRVILGQRVTSTDNSSAFRRAVAGVTLFFFGSAILAFGAQYSEPGDFLYDLETEMIEPAIGMLYTDEGYLQYHENLALERIEEMLSVRIEGSVSDEDMRGAEKQFQEHIAILESNDRSQSEIMTATLATRSGINLAPEEANKENQDNIDVNELVVLFAMAASETIVEINNNQSDKIDSLMELQKIAIELGVGAEVELVAAEATTTKSASSGVEVVAKKGLAADISIQEASVTDSTVNSTGTNNTREFSDEDDKNSVELIESKIEVETGVQLSL